MCAFSRLGTLLGQDTGGKSNNKVRIGWDRSWNGQNEGDGICEGGEVVQQG